MTRRLIHITAAVLEERQTDDGVVLVPIITRGKLLDIGQLASLHAGGASEAVTRVACMEARAAWDHAVLAGWAGD